MELFPNSDIELAKLNGCMVWSVIPSSDVLLSAAVLNSQFVTYGSWFLDPGKVQCLCPQSYS